MRVNPTIVTWGAVLAPVLNLIHFLAKAGGVSLCHKDFEIFKGMEEIFIYLYTCSAI